jgi:hypothetical protein
MAKEGRQSIKRAAVGKSPGIDGLPSELYKALLRYGSKEEVLLIVVRLAGLYNEMLRRENLPKEWIRGILTLIYKEKGDRQDLKNYRPLSIMNVDYKILRNCDAKAGQGLKPRDRNAPVGLPQKSPDC